MHAKDQPRVIRPFEPASELRFVTNHVRTSKYTVWTFLPMGLFLAFRLSTNFYFLVIAVLQSIPLISPLGPLTAIFPLVLVVSIGLLREAMDDHKRKVSDCKANSKPASVWRQGRVIDVTWQDILVGDILRVVDHDTFAADGVVLATSEPHGQCRIETSNLDGESSLKTRSACIATAETTNVLTFSVPRFTIACNPPDVDMYTFTGVLKMQEGGDFALDEQQFVPRGASLEHTKWVDIVVVYTGHETKVMKNAKAPHHKWSHVDGMVHRAVILLFLVQVALCAIGAAYHIHWGLVYEVLLLGESDDKVVDGFLTFLSFVVLLNTFIPSSLVVSLELIKTIHAKFIDWDSSMRQFSTGQSAAVTSSALVEELGQISYVFSDKTGTLTQNVMVFRKCSVRGRVYASLEEAPPSDSPRNALVEWEIDSKTTRESHLTSLSRRESLVQPAHVQTLDELRQRVRDDDDSIEARFVLAMALCHSVVATPSAPGNVMYSADSPDEGALVSTASDLGVKFLGRDTSGSQSAGRGPVLLVVAKEHLKIQIARHRVELLCVLAFTSRRKRMSVIVRDLDANTIKLICKGADSVVLDRCVSFGTSRDAVDGHLKAFAAEGLRTLCFAERIIESNTFEKWLKTYREAELATTDRERRVEAAASEIEQDLTFLATTAIEDKLQEGVAETIARLVRAHIKIWVLTGDKVETAVEIGRASHVISNDMVQVLVEGSTKPKALIVDGLTLSFALMPTNRRQFLAVATNCATVIVCRMSPLQKALVVELVKDGIAGCVTMAVGDGANDVSMIRAAHVGVGIMGEEGNQAVRSADVAIPRFHHLDRLLLYHGRLSYSRVTQCINYFFYKNVACTAPQFIFGIFSLFSGTTIFSSLYIAAFNMCFTFLPVIARAVFEKKIPDVVANQYPELYRVGPTNTEFSLLTIIQVGCIGLYHALVVTLIPLIVFEKYQGVRFTDFEVDGVAMYICIMLVTSCMIFVNTSHWTQLTVVSYWGSLFSFFACALVYDSMSGDLYGAWTRLISSPAFWLTIVLTTSLCVLPSFAVQGYVENFFQVDPVHVLQRVRFRRSSNSIPRFSIETRTMEK
ncbi:unnamed protein product [Aphanomyces euteiches]